MHPPEPTPRDGHALPLAELLGHAAQALAAVRGGESLNDALARCPAVARPGAQALVFHALRGLGGALAVRRKLAPKAPPALVDALLLTALTLLWPGRALGYAAHTVVDQAVSAARKQAGKSAGFVNAVLRRFGAECDTLVAAVQSDPEARLDHPRWWLDRLRADWPQQWESIAAADNLHPPLTLRVNPRHGSTSAYADRLAAEGLAAHVIGPQAVVVGTPVPVGRLPGFAAGDASVQDLAAQLAAPLLVAGLAPGARVLDACAAPGGKTAHLLELAELDVLALDSDPERLRRVDETLARLGLHARTQAGDAGEPSAWWDGRPFDAVLLDAPCSASGIVRRHPDARWLRRPGDIAALARTQSRLLDALWPLLRPGGRLLYCTCSVFRAEGSAQIDAFLQRQPGARSVDDPPSPGHLLPLPDNPHDGFFYALIEKT